MNKVKKNAKVELFLKILSQNWNWTILKLKSTEHKVESKKIVIPHKVPT